MTRYVIAGACYVTSIVVTLLLCVTSIADTARVDEIFPRYGSLNGGSRITIKGEGFSDDQFNFGSGRENLGNVVKMVSSTRTYDCDKHMDGTTQIQITCYTRPMVEDYYTIQITVDGVPLDPSAYCPTNPALCLFHPNADDTPTITSLSQFSGPPGQLITAYGKIITRMYEANDLSRNATNGIEDKIERVFMGGMPCEMVKPDGSLYGLVLDEPTSKYGNMTCLITTRFIGAMRFTFLIENYGRSNPDISLLKLFPGNVVATYEQYPEITSISPLEGSTEGYTYLTINGAGLDDNTVHPPIFRVGGVDCVDVLNMTDTSVVCVTPSQVTEANYVGNRGLTLRTWIKNGTDVALADIPATSDQDPGYQETHLANGTFAVDADTFGYVEGYIVPTITGSFFLDLDGDESGLCSTSLAMSVDPDQATVVIDGCVGKSETLDLEAGQPYFVRVVFSIDVDSTFTLSLFSFTAPFNYPTHSGAQNEVQELDLWSDVLEERQSVTLASWPEPGVAVNEVQTITITTLDSSYHFRLTLHGIPTALLSVGISDLDLEAAINALSCIPSDAPVTVSKLDSYFTVTFSGGLGNWPEFVPVDLDPGVTVEVSELTAGQPSYQKMIFEENGFISAPVAWNGSEAEIQRSLDQLFSVSCPDLKSYSSLYNDYESGRPSWIYGDGGVYEAVSEPFCGKSAFRNPWKLFDAPDTDTSMWIKLSPTSNRWMCFAYKGIFEEKINLYYYRYYTLPGSSSVLSTKYWFNMYGWNYANDGDNWHYNCINLLEVLQTRHNDLASIFRVKLIRVYKHPLTTDDTWVDEFMIGPTVPAYYQDIPNQRAVPPVRARSLTVARNDSSINITMEPWDCHRVDVMSIRDAPSGAVVIEKLQNGSLPVTGSVKLSRNGTEFEFPANATASLVGSVLEATDPNLGKLKVTRYDDCHGFKYTIEWLTVPGRQDLFELDTSALEGPNPGGQLTEIEAGGVRYSPLPGHMLRTHHTVPQVTVIVNRLPAACSAPSCDYSWSSDLMPTVDSIDPTSGTSGTVLTVTGSGFDGTVMENNVLRLGSTPCSVTNATDSEFTCVLGVGTSETYRAVVLVRGKGAALISPAVDFNYTVSATDFTPTTSGLGGGPNMTIVGAGLSKATLSVDVGDQECPILFSNASTIVCRIPSTATAGSVDVVIKDNGSAIITMPTQFNYDSSLTPTFTSIEPTVGSPRGGEVLTLNGYQFGFDPVPTASLVNTDDNSVLLAKLRTWYDTTITLTLPGLPDGTYDLIINIPGKGNIVDSASQLPRVNSTFEVTSITPTETSAYGGRLFTISGSGFTEDVAVTLGTTACSTSSLTSTEIICQLNRVTQTHLITNLGEDYNYNWDQPNIVIDAGDTVRWSWSSEVVTPPLYNIKQVVSLTDDEPVVGGFYSGNRTVKGSFEHEFLEAGVYFYSSGQVLDVRPSITPRGQVTVQPKPASVGSFHVSVNDVEAKYGISSGFRRRRATACESTYNDACTTDVVADPDSPEIILNPCLTRTMSTLSPNEGTSDTLLNITGVGFGTDVACVNVYVGDTPLVIESLTDTLIQARVDPNSPPALYTSLPVSVELAGNGYTAYALTEEQRSFVYKPHVRSIEPQSGSIAGSAMLTISGGGFIGDVSVLIDGVDCSVVEVIPTQIVCTTSERMAEVTGLTVDVGVQGYLAEPCAAVDSCTFSYLDSRTPQVGSISPTSVPSPDDAALTTLTISGANFATDPENVTVEIGSVPCSVLATDLSTSTILCTVANLPAGSTLNRVLVDIAPYGVNRQSDDVTVTGLPLVDSVSPLEGSVMGGTSLTIAGNGFYSDVAVSVDGVPCPVTKVDLSQVVCVTPPHVAGSVDVVVTSLDQTYPTATYAYSDAATPTVESVTPTSSYASDVPITITGTLFSDTPAENTVTIGGVPCTPTASNSTQIICTLGSNAAGTYTVDLSVAGKGIAQHPADGDVIFTYDISIATITPNEGSYGGGQVVTVSGEGLGNYTTVTICGLLCALSTATTTQYTCITSSYVGSGDTPCDVVATSGSMVTPALSEGYTYRDTLTPTVSGISPTRGGTGGGTLVTVTGTNLGTDASLVVAEIDGVRCEVIGVSDTQMICKTGAHPGNIKAPVSVSITGQGKALYNADLFYYIDVWSSKYTWGGIQVPQEGDFIVVPAGMTLLLDVSTPIIKMLLIQGGKLMFDDSATSRLTLNVENILITDGGVLEIGTEEEPFLNEAEIVLHGHLRAPELPIFGAKTIAVRNGSLELHGRPIPTTWTLLAETAEVNDTEITLQVAPINWRVGDYIVIASTGDHKSQHQNEKVQITSINGATLTFEPPLKYQHLGITETYTSPRRVTKLELRAEVGLLTRNIKIRGSSNEDWETTIEACEETFDPGEFATQTCFQGRFGEEVGSDQFGAQIMFHQPVHSSYLVHSHIEHVEITYAGQAFRLGRYPIHFHRNGDMKGSYVRGCAIHWTFNRAINIHDTHYVLIENNVVYDVMGGALFLEDSIEHDTVFQYNLVVFVKASSSLLNDDITPAGFWITYPYNVVRHNHVAGGTHFGFWYRMHENPIGPSYDPDICPRKVPLGEFYNNTVHSVGWYGLWIFEFYYPMEVTDEPLCRRSKPTAAVFRNLTTWNSFRGAEWVECGAMQFHGFVVANNYRAGIENYFVHEDVPKYSDDGALIKDSVVIGHLNYDGRPPCTKRGLVLPFANALTIDGVDFFNFPLGEYTEGEPCVGLGTVKIICICEHLCSGYTYKFRNIYWDETAPARANFEWQNQAEYEDLDGTLTGTGPGARALAQSPIMPSSCQVVAGWSVNLPGVVCPESGDVIRLTFNEPNPPSLLFKDVSFTLVDSNGVPTNQNVTVPWRDKSDTHGKGWLVQLVVNNTYLMTFDGMERVTNLSYVGTYWGLEEYDWVRIVHASIFTDPFDRVQVLADVPPEETVLLTQPPEYGEPSGSVLVSDTEGDISLTYLISGEDGSTYADDPVSFQAIKCFFPDCVDPGATENPPITERPLNYRVWSEGTTWNYVDGVWEAQNLDDGTADTMPANYPTTEVFVPRGAWIVVDNVAEIEIRCLTIEGTVEFEYLQQDDGSYLSHTLKADYIIIRGGRLLAGYGDNVYQGQLKIILTGSLLTPARSLEEGPNIGAKAMGVFGSLELHGKPHDVIWTRLRQTAYQGSTMLYLVESVDWSAGDEIVVASTGYSPWETETHIIKAVGGLRDEIELEQPLQYRHLGESETLESYPEMTYYIRAEVGLLSRNIKIMGAEDSTLDSEAYGARILVSREVDMRDETDIRSNLGYANLSCVEFSRTGQDGFDDPADPRFSLSFVYVGDVVSSKILNCSFVQGFSPAIGTFQTNNLTVQNNVFYRSVGHAIFDMGATNRWINNLITFTLWPGTFNGRFEYTNSRYEAAVEVNKADRPIIQGNVVAGAERSGYRIDGERCFDPTAPSDDSWQNNTVHSAMLGIYMMYDQNDCLLDDGCSLISNFVIYKTFFFGVYTQTGCSMLFRNVHFYDNAMAIFTVVLYPNSVEHQFARKFVRVEGGLFVGQSPSFDCDVDRTLDADSKNIVAGIEGDSWSEQDVVGLDGRKFGKVGVGWPMFMSDDNMAPDPDHVFDFERSDPSMYGRMEVEGTYFAHYGMACNGEYNVIFATNPMNPDVEQKIEMSDIKMDASVDANSLVLIEPSNIRWASSDECVDMDCDGKKVCFIVDKDGSFLGSPGTILPNAAYQWNGEPAHGLGDYRIPSVLMSNLDGTKREPSDVYDVYGHPGIDLCQWNALWNAYKCPDTIQYERLLVESMDEDFMTRRLSPVAFLCTINDTNYLDLYSGPRSTGICFGYACKERLSIFYLVAPMKTNCELYFTSSTPQNLRLHFNGRSDQWLVLGMYMGTQFRYDVYFNNTAVPALNFDSANNKLLPPPPTDPTYYHPTSAGNPGQNYFDVETKMLHVLIKGPGLIDLKMSPQIIMSATLELMTVDDFYASDKIVANLANFLNIAPENILIMNVVSEDSRRRRRATGITCTFMIGNPVPGTTTTATFIPTEDLIDLANQLILAGQTDSISVVLGTDVSDFSISRPVPPVTDTEAWQAYTELSEADKFLLPVYTPSQMDYLAPAYDQFSYEGVPFAVPPLFKIVDEEGRTVPLLVAPDGSDWLVQATLDKSDPFAHEDAYLIGSTTLPVVLGYANFTDLGISHAGFNYKITFSVINPADAGAAYEHVVQVTQVPKRSLGLEVRLSEAALEMGLMFDVEVIIKDLITNLTVPDLDWKGDLWTGQIYLNDMIDQQAELIGDKEITFQSYGYNRLSGLALRGSSAKIAISVIVRTQSADYVLTRTLVADIVGLQQIPITAYSKPVRIKFDGDFSQIEAGKELFLVGVYNWMKAATTDVEFYNMDASPGSIDVDFTVHGEETAVADALDTIAGQVRDGDSVRYGDTAVKLSPYMTVDGEYFQGLDGEVGLSTTGIIALSVIFGLLVLIAVTLVAVIVWKKQKQKQRGLLGDSTLQLKTEYNEPEEVQSQLFFDNISATVDDEKENKVAASSRASSGYASSGSGSPATEEHNTTRRRSLTSGIGQKNNKKKKSQKKEDQDRRTEEYLLSYLAPVRLPEVSSRPSSRSSVVSKQQIRTSFAPRLSRDEGTGPHTIPFVGD